MSSFKSRDFGPDVGGTEPLHGGLSPKAAEAARQLRAGGGGPRRLGRRIFCCPLWRASAAAEKEEEEDIEGAVDALRQQKRELSSSSSACHVRIAGLTASLVEARERGGSQQVRLRALEVEAEALSQDICEKAKAKKEEAAQREKAEAANCARITELRATAGRLQARQLEASGAARVPRREGQEQLLAALRAERSRLQGHLAGRRRLNGCLVEDMRALKEANGAMLQLGDRQSCGLAAVLRQNEGLAAEVKQVEDEVRHLQEEYWEGVPFSGVNVDREEVERLRRSAHATDHELLDLEKELRSAERSSRLAYAELELAKAFVPVFSAQDEPPEAAGVRETPGVTWEAGQRHSEAREPLLQARGLCEGDLLRAAAAVSPTPGDRFGPPSATSPERGLPAPRPSAAALHSGALRSLRAAKAQELASAEAKGLALRQQKGATREQLGGSGPSSSQSPRSRDLWSPPDEVSEAADDAPSQTGSSPVPLASPGVRRELNFSIEGHEVDARAAAAPSPSARSPGGSSSGEGPSPEGSVASSERRELVKEQQELGRLQAELAEAQLLHGERLAQGRLRAEIRAREEQLLRGERVEQDQLRSQIQEQQEEQLLAEQFKQEQLRAEIAARAGPLGMEVLSTPTPTKATEWRRWDEEACLSEPTNDWRSESPMRSIPEEEEGRQSGSHEALLRDEQLRQERLRAQIAAARAAVPEALVEDEWREQERLRVEIAKWTSAGLRGPREAATATPAAHASDQGSVEERWDLEHHHHHPPEIAAQAAPLQKLPAMPPEAFAAAEQRHLLERERLEQDRLRLEIAARAAKGREALERQRWQWPDSTANSPAGSAAEDGASPW